MTERSTDDDNDDCNDNYDSDRNFDDNEDENHFIPISQTFTWQKKGPTKSGIGIVYFLLLHKLQINITICVAKVHLHDDNNRLFSKCLFQSRSLQKSW